MSEISRYLTFALVIVGPAGILTALTIGLARVFDTLFKCKDPDHIHLAYPPKLVIAKNIVLIIGYGLAVWLLGKGFGIGMGSNNNDSFWVMNLVYHSLWPTILLVFIAFFLPRIGGVALMGNAFYASYLIYRVLQNNISIVSKDQIFITWNEQYNLWLTLLSVAGPLMILGIVFFVVGQKEMRFALDHACDNLKFWPVTKYKDVGKNDDLVSKIMSGKKWPWIKKTSYGIVRTINFLFNRIKPLREWSKKSLGGANGYLFKLVQEKRYEEGYGFGIEVLNDWSRKISELDKNSMHQIHYGISWWFAFESVCRCANEIENKEAYYILSELMGKAPEPKKGYPAVLCYSGLSYLANTNGNYEAAWDWINRAIESDDSYGWAYFFRAGLGIFIGKGQPLEDLVTCLQVEPKMKKTIFQDEMFIKTPLLLDDLKAALSEKGLLLE